VPVIKILASLALVPRHIMMHAMTLLAALAPELERTGRMHLSGFAVLGNAPTVVGDGVVYCFCGEFVVASGALSGG
jgi:hypothetical protein